MSEQTILHSDLVEMRFQAYAEPLERVSPGIVAENSDYIRGRVEQEIWHSPSLIVVTDKDLVAMLQYTVTPGTRQLHAHGLYVDPEHRGKGIAKALGQSLVDIAKANSGGIAKIRFDATADVDPAQLEILAGPHDVIDIGPSVFKFPKTQSNTNGSSLLPTREYEVGIGQDRAASLPAGYEMHIADGLLAMPGTAARHAGVMQLFQEKSAHMRKFGTLPDNLTGRALGHKVELNYLPDDQFQIVIEGTPSDPFSCRQAANILTPGTPHDQQLARFLPTQPRYSVADLAEFFIEDAVLSPRLQRIKSLLGDRQKRAGMLNDQTPCSIESSPATYRLMLARGGDSEMMTEVLLDTFGAVLYAKLLSGGSPALTGPAAMHMRAEHVVNPRIVNQYLSQFTPLD